MAWSRTAFMVTLLAFLLNSCWTTAYPNSSLAELNNLIPVGEDGYYMVFRVQPGIKTSAYQRYMATNKNDDSDGLMMDLAMPCGCKTTDGGAFCDRHFRSRLLNLWTFLPIDKVRVGIYKDNVEIHYLLFDGTGSKFNDWFTKGRLLSSSYTDLKSSTTNYFSISGHQQFSRRFFINHKYGGCSNDLGWLVVVDQENPPCTWEEQGPFPNILYSPYPTMTNYSAEVAVADLLVISVKMLPNTCPP